VTKPEENVLPFDPFAPVAAQQQRPSNSNPFSPSPVVHPYLGVGASPQHNLIATTPLSGGNYNFNQPVGQAQIPNMGFNVGLNQPSLGVNPTNSNPFNPLGANPVNPSLGVNPTQNYPFNPSLGANPVNPSLGYNPVNPNVGFNQTGNQPSNPYASPGFSTGTNPFTSNSAFNNNSPMTPSNPFTGPAQNTNPFLNNNTSSSAFSNQNPLF